MANSHEMSGPHIRQLDSIEKTMWNVVLALIPAIFMSIYLFGAYSLYLVVVTMLTCMFIEIPFNRNLSGLQMIFGDGSAAVTGVILGLSLPPTAPWWIPVVGGIAAILIGKQLFGGLGNNVFNPALVGRAILSVSWTVYMTQWVTPFDGVSTSTPLGSPGETTSLWDLLIGTVPGSIGETSAIALLIGAAYLYYKGYLDLRISVPYIISAGITAIILGINPIYAILAGSLILGAFFIATDMVSSPATRSGRIVYGIGCGVFTILIRAFTGYPEGVTFAILLMNGFSHLFDTLFEGYIFGQIHLKKRRVMQVGVIILSTVLFAAIAFGSFQLSERDFLEPQHRVFSQHMNEFFPHADSFNMLEDLHGDRMLAEVRQGNRRVGFLSYTKRIGYDGEIENMVAINPEGEVIGSKIINHNESATLGAQIEREDFLAQFVGLRYEDLNPTLGAGDFELDAITNATHSSIAVAQTIETSLELVNRQLHGNRFEYFALPTGRYRGTGTGWAGEMEVEVIIEDGFLMDIEVINHNDTPHKARSAFERLESRIISAQSTDVDVISGSTLSSRGMLEAVDNALAARNIIVEEIDFTHLSDGRYTGTAPGHIDDIQVEIEIEDEEIVDIVVLDHAETTYLAEPALERLIDRVLSEQTTAVEVISGATQTSQGFLAAVADAGTVEEPFTIPEIDDIYTGVGEGYQDDIEVEVTVEDGELVGIQVISHNESPDIAEPAFEELEDRIIAQQDIDVDLVTGATFSSEGYIKAVENALTTDEPEYEDGEYIATGEGYQDEIELEVIISEGEIVEISVLSHNETDDIASPAFDDLEDRVISAQSTNVDVVSSATGTSEGYLQAVSEILTGARIDDPVDTEEPEIVEMQDGKYTAAGAGYNDDIEVEITVDEGEITAIEVLEHAETEDIAEPAFEDLIEAVIEVQSTDVDTISGATGSSEGFLTAVDEAVSKAETTEIDEEPAIEDPSIELADGKFSGIAAGYNDDIEVEIVVENGLIVGIEVVEHDDTPDIAEPAFDEMKDRVIAAQDTEVDTVSEATRSSEGFLRAVNVAITSAHEAYEDIEEPEVLYEAGSYTAAAEGYNDDIEVEVTVDEEEITSIEVLDHEETEDIAEPAFEDLTEAVLETQSTDVDTISGATGSSEGFLAAIDAALSEADPQEDDKDPEEVTEEPEDIYQDGTYTGIGSGYNDDIEIELVISEGNIDSIEVLDHAETDNVAEPVFEELSEAVIDAQSTDVDTISGATGSSEGFLAAAENAIEKSEEDNETQELKEETNEIETYTAVGEGYSDDIEVKVKVEKDEIIDIEVIEHSDSPDIAEPAFEDLTESIIEAQSTEVDVVSGATGSSEGFLEAVDRALEKALQLEERPNYEDGVYTGTGSGYSDVIEVEVSVDEGLITSIEVLSHSDSPNIAEPAFEDLSESILEKQSADVDVVSGATGSSEGYLEAVEEAIDKAILVEEKPEQIETVYHEGTYTGIGDGYSDEIKIELVIQGENLESIEVIEHSDSPDIAEPAFEDLTESIIEAQSTEVDVVSGATGSSEGFLEAVDRALEKALQLEERPNYEDGVYTGTGSGYSDVIEVEVSVDEGLITSIEVLGHNDSPDIAKPAFEDLTDAVIETQSTDVDAISGATGSSEGFLSAIDEALEASNY